MRDEILRVLQSIIVPLLAADGAEVYLIEANNRSLRLHLQGRYSGCPGNTLVIRRFIEPAISAVAPMVQVSVTSGAILPPGARRLECESGS
jgi:Fe-S cluster biogenesis protein NfuA